jgi:amiloride-sensitive sodium channel
LWKNKNGDILYFSNFSQAENRPFLEKLMWFCFVLTGALSAIVIIFSLWEKFQKNPTITGLDTDFHNQEVTFPTVMVCPVLPYDENATKDLALAWLSQWQRDSNDTAEIESFLKDLSKLSYSKMYLMDQYDNEMLADTGFAPNELRKIIFIIAKKCNNTFAMCKYKDEEITCCDFFKPVFTENGFCFSFNSRYYDTEDLEY